MSGHKDLHAVLLKLSEGKTLSTDESAGAMRVMMAGEATDVQIGAFLMGLHARGETVEEIVGAVRTMREHALSVEAPEDAVDTCGTGGDSAGTFNISTAAAFILAGCGVPVAKHGNRAMTSRSGAADVLDALGVNIELTPDQVSQCIRDAGIGFMFVQRHHSAMRHVASARQELGFRTIFNLTGPMSNPANVKRQLLGVFAREWLEPMAKVLASLGSVHVWCVHGSDGLDELTTTGPSFVCEMKNGETRSFEIDPTDFGFGLAEADELKGGDADYNADAIRHLFEGETGPYRDIVLLNAGAALIVSGKANDLPAGIELAKDALDDGSASAALESLVAVSTSFAAA